MVIKILPLILVILAFTVRVTNLNYNSPFNDEAIYVVIGNLGFFQHDWSSYNAQGWLGGSQYFYPVLSSIAYAIGGLLGIRFVSALFGVGLSIIVSKIAEAIAPPKLSKVAALITFIIIAFSPVSLYISRLATYDAPSYFFFYLSLYFLLKSRTNTMPSNFYFLSALTFFISGMFKFTTLFYLPLVFISCLYELKRSPSHRKLWLIYYILPLSLLLLSFLAISYQGVISYFFSQVVREKVGFVEVFREFWQNSSLIWPMWAVGAIALIFFKKYKSVLSLFLFSSFILVFHLFTGRVSTLDKHTFLSVAFASISIGLGFSEIIAYFKTYYARQVATAFISLNLLYFFVNSCISSLRYNQMWTNSTNIYNYIHSHSQPGDKVLSEAGPPLVLAALPANSPMNITSFDWFEYQGLTGNDAYAHAVSSGYFDYIQLNTSDVLKPPSFTQIHNSIWQNLDDKYQLVYVDSNYYIYKKFSYGI